MNTGNLLVATPSVIGDFNFHRSIILLTNYQKSGSVGFILNKKLDYLLNDVMEGFDCEFPLYFGGPVEQDNLFYIHTLGDKILNSRLIIVFILPLILGLFSILSFAPYNFFFVNFLIIPALFLTLSYVSRRSKNIYRKQLEV